MIEPGSGCDLVAAKAKFYRSLAMLLDITVSILFIGCVLYACSVVAK